MKKGDFALGNLAELILVLLAALLLALFIYFLRDKIMEYGKAILDAIGL